MSSSNRHWPSMFKSKPSTLISHNNHDLNNPNFPNARNPFTQGCDDERTPEPKPRWNPRPEQIRILESIFNSGTVNPPRDEIRRIRAQLQEFGHVGDANVFYWFQNRKSRSKHKLQRHLQNSKPRPGRTPPPPPPSASMSAGVATSVSAAVEVQATSSSSSDKSNSVEKPLSISPSTFIDLLNSPTASVNQPFLQGSSQFLAEPLLFNGGSTSAALNLGVCFPDLSNCSNVLLGDLMLMNHGRSNKDEDDRKVELQQLQISYAAPVAADLTAPSPANQIPQGLPFNVREAFGDDVVLVQSSGQPVPTDEWGVTQQPLQHGAFYYLLRPFAPSPHHRTIPLI